MDRKEKALLSGCNGANCKSVDGFNHSVECLFEHFLAYTGFDDCEKLKKAYTDGYEAGMQYQSK
jgi:hypothetical protein